MLNVFDSKILAQVLFLNGAALFYVWKKAEISDLEKSLFFHSTWTTVMVSLCWLPSLWPVVW